MKLSNRSIRIGLTLATILYFFLIRWCAHLGFHTTFADLYFFDHPVWNFIHGRGLFLNIENMHEFGNHFYPYLYVLAPLYLIKCSPVWLFLVQGITMGLLAYPILSLAEQWFGRKGLLSAAFILFTTYSFRHIGMVDFHGDIVMAMLLSWSLYFIVTKQFRLLWIPIILMPLGKETFFIITIPLGLYLIYKKQFTQGILVVVYSALVAYVLIHFVMPMFHSYSHFRFYDYLGATPKEIIINAILKPQLVLAQLLKSEKIAYVLILLAPLAFLCLRSSLFWIGSLVFLQNLLSNQPGLTDPSNHYVASLIPILAFSTMLVIQKIQLRPKEKQQKIMKIFKRTVIGFAVINLLAFVILEVRYFIPTQGWKDVKKAVSLVPADASVLGTSTTLTHLYYRQYFNRENGSPFEYMIFRPVTSVSTEQFIGWWNTKQRARAIRYLTTGESFGPFEDSLSASQMKEMISRASYTLLVDAPTVRLYKKNVSSKISATSK